MTRSMLVPRQEGNGPLATLKATLASRRTKQPSPQVIIDGVALLDRAIVRFLPAVPRPLVRRISQRYIAGTELEDACRVVKELNDAGKMATIDVLGEEITKRKEALEIAREYGHVFATIEHEGLDSNVSVKLTGLGLKLDYDFCLENLRTLVRGAADRSNFVRIDMEDSSCTDDTIRAYGELRDEGFGNVGIVLQATLRRTLGDVSALAAPGLNVRLCKGIYVEPSEVAFQEFQEVRDNFVRTLDALLEAGAYVGIATHDEWLVSEALRLLETHGRGRDEYEFQMLLGVRERLGDRLVLDGHRLRIYVPYGRHWYSYSLRRLQENPKIAGYIAADTLGRLFSGPNGRR
jgi:proline dehydrogenase